jgi:hypothetical protein
MQGSVWMITLRRSPRASARAIVGTSVELLGQGVNENTAQTDDFCLTHSDVWSTDTPASPSSEPDPSRGNGSGREAGYHREVPHLLWTGEN